MLSRDAVIVDKYAQMWPRAVFDMREGKKKFLQDVRSSLRHAGVYILYRDDQPYHIGKTSRKLFSRIRHHATNARDRYFHFWNNFSAFVVPKGSHMDEVERILIAAMPTANSASPRIRRIILPKIVRERLRELRLRAVASSEAQA